MAKKLPKLYEFDPGVRIENVMLVGCGGTGAQIGRMLARLVYDMKTKGLAHPELIFVDHDLVEEGNIGRQLFTRGDIGKNKAEVLAGRFNIAMGLRIEARPHMLRVADIEEKGRDTKGFYGTNRGLLVIGAVDNANARKLIHTQLGRIAAWIDCGNHEHGGQIAIGNSNVGWRKEQEVYDKGRGKIFTKQVLTYEPNSEGQYRTLPAPTVLFPELLEPDPEGLSCAAMVERNRQALFVNDAMAVAAMNYAQKLLTRQPIHTFITYVDTITNNMRSIPLTRYNLRYAMKGHSP